VRVKCLAGEHNTVSPARARTRTARSGDASLLPEITPEKISHAFPNAFSKIYTPLRSLLSVWKCGQAQPFVFNI